MYCLKLAAMHKIIFTAHYGQNQKEVELVKHSVDYGNYDIMIGNFYYGAIVFFDGTWACQLQDKASLYSDDQVILEEIVTDHENWLDTMKVCQKISRSFGVSAWPAVMPLG